MSPSLRVSCALGLALTVSACGGGSPTPVAPSAPAPAAAAVPVLSRGPGAGGVATTPVGDPYAEGSAAAPEGFVPKFRVDPHPGDDGVIRGDDTVTVEFDLCGSSNVDGKTHFLFDWTFDHVADVVGSDSACKQSHTYRARGDAKEQTQRTNVCVTSGDPHGAAGDVFFSCRQYTVALRKAPQRTEVCGIFFGGDYTECLDVQARILRQDYGNDGSFENAWYISTDTVVGSGSCGGDEIANYQFSDPAFYAFMIDHGFEPGNEFCAIPV